MVCQCLAGWLQRESARKGNGDYLAQGRLTTHLREALCSQDTRPHRHDRKTHRLGRAAVISYESAYGTRDPARPACLVSAIRVAVRSR